MAKKAHGASDKSHRSGWRPNPLPRIDKKEVDKTIIEQFQEMARMHRDRPAVKFGDDEMTYGRLDSLSNRLARRIVEAAGTANDPVAALLEEGINTTVVMLAAMKAGKIYAPLDAAYPAPRLEYMISDTGAAAVVTDTAHLPLAEQLCKGRTILNLDDVDERIPDGPLELSVTPGSIATILYTSGSTGEPKGVVSDHRQNVYGALKYRKMMGLRPSDRTASFMSFAFAGGMRMHLWALLNGAAVVCGTLENTGDLAGFFRREEISIAILSPSLLKQFLASVRDPRALPNLRMLYVGGEPLHRPELERFKELFPDGVTLLNVLAMTEAGSVRQFAADEADDFDGDLVPVGYELGDMEITILDDERKPVKPGEIGQIAIRSRYVGLGYWRKPEATNAVFLPDTDTSGKRTYITGDLGRMLNDGCLIHLGRKDLMVKVRAYRVEVSEVEAALKKHPTVKDAAVAACADRPGDERLVGYVVPRDKAAIEHNELRRSLSRELPEYMVPSVFVVLDALPLNLHGKVDRRALPAPPKSRPELTIPFVAPRTPVEQEIAAIWAPLLGVDRVGVNDSFFDLGGHSLLATQAVARMCDAFGVKIPLTALFEEPTVFQMAIAVTGQLAAGAQPDEMQRIMDELESR